MRTGAGVTDCTLYGATHQAGEQQRTLAHHRLLGKAAFVQNAGRQACEKTACCLLAVGSQGSQAVSVLRAAGCGAPQPHTEMHIVSLRMRHRSPPPTVLAPAEFFRQVGHSRAIGQIQRRGEGEGGEPQLVATQGRVCPAAAVPGCGSCCGAGTGRRQACALGKGYILRKRAGVCDIAHPRFFLLRSLILSPQKGPTWWDLGLGV